MECCLKGKCAPTAKSDDCCKNTVPGANHFLASKAAGHWVPFIALSPAPVSEPVPASSAQNSVDLHRHPPPAANFTAQNLPLLI